MINWDAEDAENKALGRLVPGINPPDQPYCELDNFKVLSQQVLRIATIQGQRIEQEVGDEVLEDCDDEDMDNGDYLQPQPISQHPPPPPHHHDTPIFHLSTVKCRRHREPRYYFGSPLHRRRSPKFKANNWNNSRTIPPPDIRLPKAHPLSPNICTKPYLRRLQHQHPPDIVAPKSPKPNISSY
jgi:hypothetical protein